MEVGDTLHAAGRRPCGPRAPGLAASLLLVVVVAQHKAEQQLEKEYQAQTGPWAQWVRCPLWALYLASSTHLLKLSFSLTHPGLVKDLACSVCGHHCCCCWMWTQNLAHRNKNKNVVGQQQQKRINLFWFTLQHKNVGDFCRLHTNAHFWQK